MAACTVYEGRFDDSSGTVTASACKPCGNVLPCAKHTVISVTLERLAEAMRIACCEKCNGAGKYTPPCYRCNDSTDDHDCPSPRVCDHVPFFKQVHEKKARRLFEELRKP